MSLPILGITMGDPTGIGPEITIKTLLEHPEIHQKATPVVIGDLETLRRAAVLCGHNPNKIRGISSISQASNCNDKIEVIQCGSPLPPLPWGKVTSLAGDAAYRYVTEACRLGRENQIQGIVTAPLNKEAMHLGGHGFPGHTEILAEEFGVKNYSMILSSEQLFVFHLSTHIPLSKVSAACNETRTYQVITLAGAVMKAIGKSQGRIALCGLNPHAGENGLFGEEEQTQLSPAVRRAAAEGINIVGPLPADAVFPQAVAGKWDAVIACYHDQGHGPFKSVYGQKGVNITAGLPVVRVSVDHGTGFDIAGKGIANEESLVLSCLKAAELGPGWKKVWQTTQKNSA